MRRTIIPLPFQCVEQLARPLAFRPDKIGDGPHDFHLAGEIGRQRLEQPVKRLARNDQPLNIAPELLRMRKCNAPKRLRNGIDIVRATSRCGSRA